MRLVITFHAAVHPGRTIRQVTLTLTLPLSLEGRGICVAPSPFQGERVGVRVCLSVAVCIPLLRCP